MSQESPQRTARRTRRQMRSLDWSEKAIDQAAQVGPEDADAVAAWFDKHAPKAARTLLESSEQEPDAE